jgi:hypothetical protein
MLTEAAYKIPGVRFLELDQPRGQAQLPDPELHYFGSPFWELVRLSMADK